MPDLGVAHLSVGQPDGLTRGDERRVRILAPQLVEDGRLRERHGIAGPGRRAPPPVEDDERYELERAAARHMEANESRSSEAPPTSAPSTSGCAISSPALSGFTEPPYSTGRSSSDLMKACASCASSGVAVRPVPIAHTGSYASTSPSSPPHASRIASTWMRRTISVSPPSRHNPRDA